MQIHVGERNEIFLFDVARVIVSVDDVIFDNQRRQAITFVGSQGQITRVEFRARTDEPLLDPSDKRAVTDTEEGTNK